MNTPAVADFLLMQLQAAGVELVFGVPDDYVPGYNYWTPDRSGTSAPPARKPLPMRSMAMPVVVASARSQWPMGSVP